MKKLYKAANIILIAAFAVLILLRIFYKLGDFGWLDTDEAKHAVNAYETFKTGSWVAHVYEWDVDYVNSKPPLYFWITNILFGIFGINTWTFKLPSAIAGAILCVILAVFSYRQTLERVKKKSLALTAVLMYLVVFLSMDLLYDYHMFRTGNFDAIYALFMLCGMIFMIKAGKDNRFLIPFGVLAGFSFLSKGFNAGSIVLAALFCIPFLAKEKRIRYILYSILAATLVVLPWAVLRFMFDGTEFFYNMFFGEAADKVVGSTLDFVLAMPKTRTFRFLFYSLIVYLIALFLSKKSLKTVWQSVLSDIKEYAILWIWLWATILFYSLAGFYNEWYIYPSYIISAVLSGIYVGIGLDLLSEAKLPFKVIATLALCALMFVSASNGIYRLGSYWLAGNSGGRILPFWADMKDLKEKYGDQYRGCTAYIEDISHYVDLDEVSVEDAPIDQRFFFDLRAYAEYELDWQCKSGGIDAWEQDEDAIMVVEKQILDRYIDRLSGYVIIEDNGYIYFSHDRY